jgi:hypothetical protein
MRQSITVTEPHSAHRGERKRSVRAGLPHQVVVVRLRRASLGDDEEDTDEHGRNWTHRWLVGAHWRNQWYPSRGRHEPILISPYVKGPVGLPLVVKERITAWVR